jgi:hypothetical protein
MGHSPYFKEKENETKLFAKFAGDDAATFGTRDYPLKIDHHISSGTGHEVLVPSPHWTKAGST